MGIGDAFKGATQMDYAATKVPLPIASTRLAPSTASIPTEEAAASPKPVFTVSSINPFSQTTTPTPIPFASSDSILKPTQFGLSTDASSLSPALTSIDGVSSMTKYASGGLSGLKTKTQSAAQIDNSENAYGYKVRLFAVRNFPADNVIFEVSPVLSESRNIEYATVSPPHLPGSIQIYRKTGSRSFSLSAKFVSRNTPQATKNMEYIQRLRGWTMPYFGLKSGSVDNSMLGAPPDVLYLYAYTDGKNATTRSAAYQTNIKKVPVVIVDLTIDYPDDVDYVASASGEPIPVKMEVKIGLLETHSPKGYEDFSLDLFKQGRMIQF